jgi:uncharacterized protein YcbX
MKSLGRIASITRFPVKSMRGERLEQVDLGAMGIAGDRRYAFVKSDDRGRFPWLTARDFSELVRWTARYENPENPGVGALTLTAPDGETFEVNDPRLVERLSEQSKKKVHLMQLGRGTYDAMPVSLLATNMSERLAAEHGSALDLRRFRINILVEATEGTEIDWVDQALNIGDTQLMVSSRIERCVMVTIDPDTAERNGDIIKTVARKFGNLIGVYASISRKGRIAVGDELTAV